MFRSIRWRIAVPYTLLILVTMVVLGVYLSRLLRQTYIEDLRTEQTALAQLLAEVLNSSMASGADGEELNAHAERWGRRLACA